MPDLCRSLRAKYFGDELVNGIETKHYEAAEDLFDLTSAENLCYCHGVESCAAEVEGEDAWDLAACPQCSLGLMNSQGCQVILIINLLVNTLNARLLLHIGQYPYLIG